MCKWHAIVLFPKYHPGPFHTWTNGPPTALCFHSSLLEILFCPQSVTILERRHSEISLTGTSVKHITISVPIDLCCLLKWAVSSVSVEAVIATCLNDSNKVVCWSYLCLPFPPMPLSPSLISLQIQQTWQKQQGCTIALCLTSLDETKKWSSRATNHAKWSICSFWSLVMENW